jgi:hypothetical protein
LCSGPLTGFVDIIVELRRLNPEQADDRRRTLTAYSRFDETPRELDLELTDAGYVAVGSKADAKREDRQSTIAEILVGHPGGADDRCAARAVAG